MRLSVKYFQSQQLKILFFGTDTFSVASLEALNREKNYGSCIERLETCCVLNNQMSAVKSYCNKHSVKLHAWPPPTALCQEFDLGIVASFGRMFPARVINAFPRFALNG